MYIHRSRLERVSPWFKRTAVHAEVIELDHVGLETLQTFYNWVYGDCIDVEGLEEEMAKRADDAQAVGKVDSSVVVDLREDPEEHKTDERQDGDDEGKRAKSTTPSTLDDGGGGEELPWYMSSPLNTRGQIFGRLLDLYTFGITYEVPDFKLDVILTWQRFSHTKSTYPSATVVRNIVQRVSITSGLVQYLIGCYAYEVDIDDIKKDRDRFSTMQSEFLTEVLILALGRVKNDTADEEPNKRWCEYHEHETEEAKERCRDKHGRRDDPDMQYKRSSSRGLVVIPGRGGCG